MPHFKRGRAKSRRAGCVLCKPWKQNGIKGTADARPIALRRLDEPDTSRLSPAKRFKPRPFVIEARWRKGYVESSPWGDWQVHRRYATEAARDEALARFQRKSTDRMSGYGRAEFRAGAG